MLLLMGREGAMWQRDIASGTNKEAKDFKESTVSVLCSSLGIKGSASSFTSLLPSGKCIEQILVCRSLLGVLELKLTCASFSIFTSQ